ncbi:MAG TPA: META domain-containing protein [Chitinophagaceae bacterium]
MKQIILILVIAGFFICCNNNKTNESSKTGDTSITVTSPDTAITTTDDGGTHIPATGDTTNSLTPPADPPPGVKMKPSLDGNWELEYISGPKIAFEALYPGKKPNISFDVANNTVSGNTSCNSFSGKLKADSIRINFTEPFVMTKMACPGEGEATFLQTIKKVNKYNIDGNTLTFIMGDIAMMRFKRK